MSDWIKTKAGLQMAETIIRYLPRVFNILEQIAKKESIDKYKEDLLKMIEEMDGLKQSNINLGFRLKEIEKLHRVANTPVGKDSELSYVLTDDIKKVNEIIKKTPEYKRALSIVGNIGYRGEE